MFAIQVPFANFPVGHERILITRQFLFMLVRTVLPEVNPKLFFKDLFFVRYAPSFKEIETIISHHVQKKSPLYIEYADWIINQQCFADKKGESQYATQFLQPYVKRVTDIFTSPLLKTPYGEDAKHPNSNVQSIIEIKLGNYIERVIQQAVDQNDIFVPYYLKNCLIS